MFGIPFAKFQLHFENWPLNVTCETPFNLFCSNTFPSIISFVMIHQLPNRTHAPISIHCFWRILNLITHTFPLKFGTDSLHYITNLPFLTVIFPIPPVLNFLILLINGCYFLYNTSIFCFTVFVFDVKGHLEWSSEHSDTERCVIMEILGKSLTKLSPYKSWRDIKVFNNDLAHQWFLILQTRPSMRSTLRGPTVCSEGKAIYNCMQASWKCSHGFKTNS